MEPIKIIIDIKDGEIQAVYSNEPLQYIVIDRDGAEKTVVHPVLLPDVIHPDLYQLYDRDTANGLEIRSILQQLKF